MTMHPLEPAIEAARRLRERLAAELAHARAFGAVLGRLDADAIVAECGRREQAQGGLADLQAALARELATAAGGLGIAGEVSLEVLRARAPQQAVRLADVLAGVRLAAAALRQMDETNQRLARRALASVHGLLAAFAPTPSAYDRRGAATAAQKLSTSNRVA